MSMPKTLANRQALEKRYKNSRSNLLLIVALSVINVVLLVTNSSLYFLFSAYIPYALVDLGMFLCGRYPQELYGEIYGEEFANMEFFGTPVFAVFIVLALIVLAVYLLCWIFSKKNKIGWLIFALVMFVGDTLTMFLLNGITNAMDLIFHIAIIVSLSFGISAGVKLKKLADEDAFVPVTENGEEYSPEEDYSLDSSPIRSADLGVKAKILLEATAFDHVIVYRRVKKVNELVIDGQVYDELEGLIEKSHCLKAQVDGHQIEVGLDILSNSYIQVDGQIIARKQRII